ncbi:hypothetical protein ACFLRF_05085 [Candidatus Altiarchaeota archaeon]
MLRKAGLMGMMMKQANDWILFTVLMLLLVGTVHSQEDKEEPEEVVCQCDESMKMFFGVAGMLAILAVVYFYNLTQSKGGLEAQIIHHKEIILKQRAEIKHNEGLLKSLIGDLSDKQKVQVTEEIEKSKDIFDTQKAHKDRMQNDFWAKIDLSEGMTDEEEKELKTLEDKYTELKGLIDITKSKYYKRLIDEASFNDITRDYQKELIEVESRIATLKKKNAEK